MRIYTSHALTANVLTDGSDYTGAYLISVYFFRHREMARFSRPFRAGLFFAEATRYFIHRLLTDRMRTESDLL